MYYGKSEAPLGSIPNLTPAEEKKLFSRYKRSGDPAAKEILVKRYLPWAFKIAAKLKGPRLPLEDAVSAANEGLMMAFEEFQPRKGYRFTSYSYLVIRRYVIEALIATYPVELTSHFRKKLKRGEKLKSGEALCDVPTLVRDVPSTLSDTFRRMASPCTTFSKSQKGHSIGPGSKEGTFFPVPEFEQEADSPVEAIEYSSAAEDMKAYIASKAFTRTERTVMVARHYAEPMESFQNLGLRLKLSKKVLHEAYASGMAKLRLRFNPDGKN